MHGLLRYQLLPFYAAVVGVILSGLLLILSVKSVLSEEEEQFLSEAEHVRDVLFHRLNSTNELMHSLTTFYNASTNVDSDDFRIFASTFLDRHDFLTSLYYMPKVLSEDRYSFVEKMKDEGYFGFEINTWENGLFSKQIDSEFYFPVIYIEPHTPATIKQLGMDVNSIPQFKKAVNNSIESASIASSSPVNILHNDKDLLLFRPLYKGKDHVPARPSERHIEVNGLLGASININKLVKDVSGSYHLDVQLHLYSSHLNENDESLVSHSEHKDKNKEQFIIVWFDKSQEIDLDGYKYVLLVKKPLHFNDINIAFIVYSIFVGVAISLLLILTAKSISSKAKVLETKHAEVTSLVKERTKELHHLAHHDNLTGLPNRVMFMDRLEHAISRAHRFKKGLAVLFLDLDRFKVINDSLGHAVGDILLKEISKRLLNEVRESDTVARLGGDEFTVILEDIDDDDEVSKLTFKINRGLSEALKIQGHDLVITSSTGISLYPTDSEDLNELIKFADTAMYKAKESGRNNFKYYSENMGDKAENRLIMEMQLREAVEHNQFTLLYQPKIDANTGKLVGSEALIRWNHPERGIVSPLEFIPLLEDTGLIVTVGEWVLKQACAQLKDWKNNNLDNIHMAVNLSIFQLNDTNFSNNLSVLLKEIGIDAGLLELEITESMLMTNVEDSIKVLNGISAQGVSIAIDDFGTGYSSLSYLKSLPLNTLKIDRSFIEDITTSTDDLAIVSTIIAMAKTMNFKVVAEGVETIEQESLLKGQGCDYLQGYLISRPISAEEFLAKYQ